MSAETDAAAQAAAPETTPEAPVGGDLPTSLTSTSIAATEAKSDPAHRHRDVPVSTLVRLMGLPTAADLTVLETKIDILTTKVATVGARVERIASQLMEIFHDFDRFDVQIADLREFIKGSLASVIGKVDSLKDSSSPNGGDSSSAKNS